MAKTTTIVVSLETWQKLNVIKNQLGIGSTMEDAVKECWAVRREHEACAELLLRQAEKLRELEQ